MKDTALFTHLLGLSNPWRITAITPNLTDKSMIIQIDWLKERKARVVPAMPFVRFTTTVSSAHGDIDTMQFKTHLVAQAPRIHCE